MFAVAQRTCLSSVLLLFCGAVAAGETPLADLSLEELANLRITSVSRRAERLGAAAASVYVITAEAIRRSGATSLPQVLRLAPNLQVAQSDAAQFAITARGFNNAIGNKLLVLIDGRTVYTPFFSGVFWDQQDLMLDDVERIEVISGPGATLWGANAVNGVINVVTREARDTQGLLLAGDVGSHETQAALRFGGALPGNGHFRVYGKRVQRDGTRSEDGTQVKDGITRQQAGWRADWLGAQDSFTLQGDIYKGDGQTRALGSITLSPTSVSGYNVLGRWTRRWTDGSSLRLQAYVDHSERDDSLLYRPVVDIADIEMQHSLQHLAHKVVWGGGLRGARDNIQPGLFFGFHPARRTQRWSNVFVQDAIKLAPEVELTLGAKLEHNDYTGTEHLPSARVGWQLSPDHLLWGAISRAVRAPARLDRDISLPPTPPYIIAGGPDFISEVAKVAELGWRAQLVPEFTFSATAFLHRWDRLRSGQLPPDALVQNGIEGSTQGVEAWALWQATAQLRLSAGGSTLRERLHVSPGSSDPVGPSALGNDPQGQWQLRASFNPTAAHELDLAVRHVAALPNPALPAYTATDLRWGWRVSAIVSLAALAQNVFDRGHAEFGAAPGRSELPRSLMLQLKCSL